MKNLNLKILLLVLFFMLSSGAKAVELYCIDGQLYVAIPHGSTTTLESVGGCDGGGSICYNLLVVSASNSKNSAALQANRGVPKNLADKIVHSITTKKSRDNKLSFSTTNDVISSFKKRAHIPSSTGTLEILKESIPEWLLSAINKGTTTQNQRSMTTGSGQNSESGVAYPPHGYPCLGCHPCPGNTSEYCDDFSSILTPIDLSVAQVKLGYKIVDGKLVVPKSGKK